MLRGPEVTDIDASRVEVAGLRRLPDGSFFVRRQSTPDIPPSRLMLVPVT